MVGEENRSQKENKQTTPVHLLFFTVLSVGAVSRPTVNRQDKNIMLSGH